MASGRIRLPKRLAQVGAFAMANPDEIAFGTVASIAEKAAVQPSTLVRFSQAIGFQGFSDLQAVFRDRLRDRVAPYDDRLRSLRADGRGASAAAAVFDGFCAAATRSIEALHERADLQAIDAAVALLARAETIYLIAQRRSYPIASTLNYAFGKLGVKTVLVGSPNGVDAETVSFATERDAAIAISFTPYASATVDLTRQIARRTPVVVVTDSPFSPLVADGRIWFEVVEADYQGFRSLAATMALAMTLAVAVAEARRRSAENGTYVPD
ncbi:MurR/RpiR family transcriptional regulator [Chthonobacter rhizosphaerae]|uniref:MurR/RpiR family transcriptional regulator n=1 Tax=Chthonobacter rhizosphaerae TaxID=2735553 RepID=UPI001FE8CF7A|nr:MurR/RpiR family transcriptional regulator [Chthonobacter rhizosphaerae]